MGHVRRGPGGALGIQKHKRARSTKVLISSLWGYISKYVGAIIISAALTILYSLTSLATPLVAKQGIDNLIGGSTFSAMLPLVIMFLAFTVIGWVFNSVSTRVLARINSKMLHEVRSDLYEKLSFSDMSYLKNEQSGNITARVTSDTGELATGINLSSSMISQILLIIGSFIILLVTNWMIALISLAAIPVAFLISAVLSYFGRKIVLRVRRAFGFVSGKMAEGLGGIAIAKSFNREEELATELRELNQEHYRYSKQFGLLMMFVFPAINSLSYALFTIIIYAGGWINNNSTTVLTPGELYLAINLSQQFLFPIVMLAMHFPQLEAAFGAMDRIIDVFDAKPAVIDKYDAVELKEGDDSVHFKNLSFAYEADTYVLRNVSFSVKPGEMVAVVGHTGAGKTTLLSALLTRFYDIQEGSIRIGEQDIKSVTQSSLRNAIGLVTQEPFLFTGTVKENILYGAPDATDEDLLAISKRINADEFIEALPQGYETIVVEGGKKLSAGQRQIITIARTMLANPRILVLDEATSRLDAYTESLVQVAQAEMFKGRTTFVIAHRLSTIRDANKIVVLDHGKLKEIGSHDELISKKDGIYADLYNTYYAHQGLGSIELSVDDLEPEILDESEQIKKASMMMGGFGGRPGGHGKGESQMKMKGNMSPEMMKKLESLPPEKRKEMMEKMRSMSPSSNKKKRKRSDFVAPWDDSKRKNT